MTVVTKSTYVPVFPHGNCIVDSDRRHTSIGQPATTNKNSTTTTTTAASSISTTTDERFSSRDRKLQLHNTIATVNTSAAVTANATDADNNYGR